MLTNSVNHQERTDVFKCNCKFVYFYVKLKNFFAETLVFRAV